MVSPPEAWTQRAATGYSWPPFEEGNTANLRHGAFSSRTWQPMAVQLVQGILESFPELSRFPEVLRSWSDAEARAELLRQHLDEVGMFSEDGQLRKGPLEWLRRFDAAAQRYRSELGLAPRAEAEIARLQAEAGRSVVDLEAIRVSGANALASRRAELAKNETDNDRRGPS